jgi:hypothetical protein
MLRTDKNALICDLAETYHIFDYKQLPPSQVAILAIGLRDNSRIKMKLSGSKVPPDIFLLVGIFDRLNLLFWSKTKDAEKGRNRPKPLLSLLYEEQKDTDIRAYSSGEDFLKEREKLLKKAGRR